MDLFFLRHGLAGNRSEWQGDDAKRPLTDEGKAKMKRTAATLATLDLGLDVIITSPLARARQTAEIVARELNCTLVEDKRLAPGFNTEQLSKILLDHPNANKVMLVGHEPDFSETISALIGGGRIVCKKGGLVLVTLPNAHSKHGELVWLVPPKVLAR
jgi:phosphohistidine phosphatase